MRNIYCTKCNNNIKLVELSKLSFLIRSNIIFKNCQTLKTNNYTFSHFEFTYVNSDLIKEIFTYDRLLICVIFYGVT